MIQLPVETPPGHVVQPEVTAAPEGDQQQQDEPIEFVLSLPDAEEQVQITWSQSRVTHGCGKWEGSEQK